MSRQQNNRLSPYPLEPSTSSVTAAPGSTFDGRYHPLGQNRTGEHGQPHTLDQAFSLSPQIQATGNLTTHGNARRRDGYRNDTLFQRRNDSYANAPPIQRNQVIPYDFNFGPFQAAGGTSRSQTITNPSSDQHFDPPSPTSLLSGLFPVHNDSSLNHYSLPQSMGETGVTSSGSLEEDENRNRHPPRDLASLRNSSYASALAGRNATHPEGARQRASISSSSTTAQVPVLSSVPTIDNGNHHTGYPIIVPYPPSVFPQATTTHPLYQSERNSSQNQAGSSSYLSSQDTTLASTSAATLSSPAQAATTSNVDAQSGKKYCCPSNCGMSYLKRTRAEACNNKHTGVRPYICEGKCGTRGCTKAFFGSENLAKHINKTKAKCPWCGTLGYRRNAKRHGQSCKKRPNAD